jgi:putative ABC transport system permease protein
MHSILLAQGLDPANLVAALPGGIAQGLIWGVMALGVFITFRILDIADLTVDGSFTTGGAVAVMMILSGHSAPFALVMAFLAGMLAGLCTGLLHTALGIPAILASILTQLALYSINLAIMGMSSNQALSVDKYNLVLSSRNIPHAILIALIFCIVTIAVLYWYFGTQHGSSLRATGCNPTMAKAQGININTMKIIGLSLSNGLVALSGGLLAQYQGFADINMGRGSIVIGLAAIIIGEVLGTALFRKYLNFAGRLAFIVIGAIIYYLVIVVVLWMRLPSAFLKMFSSIIVAIFLAVPYLQNLSKTSFKRAGRRSARRQAGDQK